MKIKRLLRFYFRAEELNDVLDRIAVELAVRSGSGIKGAEYYFDRISKVVEEKQKLAIFWRRLDGFISYMSERDLSALRLYALRRSGESVLTPAEKREIHRAVVKFTRRAENLLSTCQSAYALICAYYPFLRPA